MTAADYLVLIVSPLLSRPEALTVATSEDTLGTLLTVVCHKADMGTIIGKSGDTAKCLRHLARLAGIRQGVRVSVKINEPDGSAYRPRPREEAVTQVLLV